MASLAASLVCAALECGCGSVRGAIPALVIGTAFARSASASIQSDATSQNRSAWTARADLSLVWLPTPHTATSAATRIPRRLRDDAAPCASEALCAWERRARARALQRLNPETPRP